MMIFRATRDLRKVSLWLGHAQMQTTGIYLRADPTKKTEAIEAVPPLSLKRGRFSATDKLIASLRGVSLRTVVAAGAAYLSDPPQSIVL
jgi:integrase/recombinase XerD